MQSSTILLLALSALATALPSPSDVLPKRSTCVSMPPTSYTINGFTTFTPAQGNPVPPSINFRYSDSVVQTTCSVSGQGVTGGPCANPAVTFNYDANGHKLTLTETYLDCASHKSKTLTSTIGISTYCYPVEPPVPNGYGTQCQTPSGQVGGSY